jgi:hypothetical protein
MTKLYHYGKRIRADGAVSALCYDTPRKIDLGKASWVLRKNAVTCAKCISLLEKKTKSESAKS